MFKKLGIGCLGIIGIIIILGVIGAIAGGGKSSSSASSPSGASSADTAPSQPSRPPGSDRTNPVPFGSDYTFKKNNATYTVRVTDVRTNAAAFVNSVNQFNTKPPDGNDYIVPELALAYTTGSQTQAFKTTDGGYKFYAGNRFWGAPSINVAAEPQLVGQDIFPGATVEGWLAGRYMPVELIDEAQLVYDDVYFALK